MQLELTENMQEDIDNMQETTEMLKKLTIQDQMLTIMQQNKLNHKWIETRLQNVQLIKDIAL